MPIDQTITAFPAAPNAGSDTPEEFSNKADAFVAHQSDNYVGEVNTWATEANSTATDVNTDASNAAASAGESAASAVLANEWAENPEDDPVVAGEYSALHWAAKAAAVDALQPDVTSLQIQGDYLSAFSFKNKLINGEVTRINQRSFSGTWVDGEYGYDRWKATATAMVQIIEDGNYTPSVTHTLSGEGVTTQQLTSPASGDWTIPEVPRTATNIQLEQGSVATPFEVRPIGMELSLCHRYFNRLGVWIGGTRIAYGQAYTATNAQAMLSFPEVRAIPVITPTGSFTATTANGGTNPATLSFSFPEAVSARIIATTSGLVAGNATGIAALDDSSYIDVDAEL